jgi:hypothetical protein
MLLDNEKLAKASEDVDFCQKMTSKTDGNNLFSKIKGVIGIDSASVGQKKS